MGEQCERLRQEGIVIGAERTSLDYIVAMLKKGYSIGDISDITKKSEKDILAIKNKNKL